MDNMQQMICNQFLLSLERVVLLGIRIDAYSIRENRIKSYESHFKSYNPHKPNCNRFGLSITSLDGKFSGDPDLYSLREYNRNNGTSYEESDFRTHTPFYKECKELSIPMKVFEPFMGRTHVLRLDKGGFFPPHRDSNLNSFRLFAPLIDNSNYIFLVDDKRVLLDRGCVYFVQTMVQHSLFSFKDNSYFIVFNIDLCKESIEALNKSLSAK